MRNKKFNCVLDNLKLYLISKDNSNPNDIQEINQHYNKTDIIIIDNYEEPDEKYFILCFDKIIWIIEQAKIQEIQFFLSNSKSSLFIFLKNTKDIFDNHIKFDYVEFDNESSFYNELEVFKSQFIIQPIQSMHITRFWRIIRSSFLSFLLKKSYRYLTSDRVYDILLKANISSKNEVIQYDEYIKLNDFEYGKSVNLCY